MIPAAKHHGSDTIHMPEAECMTELVCEDAADRDHTPRAVTIEPDVSRRCADEAAAAGILLCVAFNHDPARVGSAWRRPGFPARQLEFPAAEYRYEFARQLFKQLRRGTWKSFRTFRFYVEHRRLREHAK